MRLKNIWSNNHWEGFFRKQVVINKMPENAYARIYVDPAYEFFINGRFVAEVSEHCNTRDYNVKVFLKEGVNQIAVHGLNQGGHRGFVFELCIDGEIVVTSNGDWKSADHEEWGWMLEEFDDSNWDNANELNLSAAGETMWWDKPGENPDWIIPTLDASQFFRGNIPKSCSSPYWTAKEVYYTPDKNTAEVLGEEYEEFAKTPHLPKIYTDYTILQNTAREADGKIVVDKTERYTGPSFIVDLGHEVVGFFRMKLSSEGNMSFRLYYGETLDEAMYEPVHHTCENRMLREEYHLFNGTQEFEARTRVAYRFVRVEFFDCEKPVTAEMFSTRTTLYPVARKGYFVCDDEEMTKLWEMGERTLHFCMQEYYLDAPKRDRFLWTGDSRMHALINYYTFGDTALFEYCWDELAKIQRPDGGICSAYGDNCSMLWDYVAWYIIAFYDYYMFTGNKDFFVKHKVSIEKATDYLTSLTNENGVIDIPENPLGKLWMVVLNEYVGVDPYLNELYLRCLETTKLVEELSGDSEMEAKYAALIKKTAPEVEKLLADERMIKEFDDTLHTQLQYELAEQSLLNGKIDDMIARIRKCWCPMTHFGADCLLEGTWFDSYSQRIDEHRTDKPFFGSYCHAWTAAATVLLPMGVAGITPTAPGFETVDIKPQANVFGKFKCAVPTPKGVIAVKYEGGKLEYAIPNGITAKVVWNGTEKTVTGKGIM